jgi:hypothetical protein
MAMAVGEVGSGLKTGEVGLGVGSLFSPMVLIDRYPKPVAGRAATLCLTAVRWRNYPRTTSTVHMSVPGVSIVYGHGPHDRRVAMASSD